jgi:hypothetical protein
MKVTSYKISKKLKEIGFKAETEINWVEYQKYNRDKEIITWHEDERVETWESVDSLCRAYDLETILEALPTRIEGQQKLCFDKDSFGYFKAESINCSDIEVICERLQKESLTDCAARMLILLYEKGLIKLKL